jgi:hypothetical protein
MANEEAPKTESIEELKPEDYMPVEDRNFIDGVGKAITEREDFLDAGSHLAMVETDKEKGHLLGTTRSEVILDDEKIKTERKNKLTGFAKYYPFGGGDRLVSQGGGKITTEEERAELAQQAGWHDKEAMEKGVYDVSFEKTGEGKIMKVTERESTGDEIIRKAATELNKAVAELERDGSSFVKKKESWEHQKTTNDEMVKLAGGIMSGKEDFVLAQSKVDSEVAQREGAIKDQEDLIAERKNEFKDRIEKGLAGINEMIGTFSPLLGDVKAKEAEYLSKSKDLNKHIEMIRKANYADGQGEIMIKAIEEEKAKNEAIRKEFATKRLEIQKRLSALEAGKKEAEKSIERISYIGKTRTEIEAMKKEKEEAKQAKNNTVEKSAKPKGSAPEEARNTKSSFEADVEIDEWPGVDEADINEAKQIREKKESKNNNDKTEATNMEEEDPSKKFQGWGHGTGEEREFEDNAKYNSIKKNAEQWIQKLGLDFTSRERNLVEKYFRKKYTKTPEEEPFDSEIKLSIMQVKERYVAFLQDKSFYGKSKKEALEIANRKIEEIRKQEDN